MIQRADIEKCIEQIHETAEQEDIKVTRGAADQVAREDRINEMRHLAGQFAAWAVRHNIPYDRSLGRFKKVGRWTLARRVINEEKGSYEMLEVDRQGEIDTGWRPESNAKKYLEDEKIDSFWPGTGVNQRIAELCVKHGIEWDME